MDRIRLGIGSNEGFSLTELEAWEVVPLKSDMNDLDSTWAFTCKRFPHVSIRKFKARFCCRGGQQVHSIDYFDAFAPVFLG